MKLNNLSLLFALYVVSLSNGNAQTVLPQGYFTFPINPGQTNYLAANMGELRNNHFHGGLDVKTDRRIGYPVYASAEGYVTRIKVSTLGYGNVVYIRHPNNYVTVYAHLDKFNTEIGDYIRKKQYELQSFEVDVYLQKNELPVKNKEVIGLAGNSGSSQGPHLHYEIRDTLDRLFNPSFFGFKEIFDSTAPSFDKVAFQTLSIDSRVNNEFGRTEVKALKTGNQYTLENKIQASGWVGLELKAFDKKNGVYNSFGINFIQVFLDDKEIFRHDINSFTFDETRYINAHINYSHFTASGRRFERLYVADGNKLASYKTNSTRGKFFINDQLPHKVKILIKDDFNNESVLTFEIQGQRSLSPEIKTSSFPNQGLTKEIHENILKLSTKAAGDPGARLFFKGNPAKLNAAYQKSGSIVYLYDLRKGLPDSVLVGTQKEVFNFVKVIPSAKDQQVNVDKISLTIPANTLADTVFFEYKKELLNNTEVYHIHNKSVPLFDTITLGISPANLSTRKSNTFIYSINSGKPLFEGGEWKGDKIEVKTRILGKFTLAEDTTKPSIRFVENFGNSIKFSIADDFSGIKSFNAKLDGYWILMNYDHKRRLIWSERLDKRVPLKGKFELEVIDNAGNVNNFILNL